MSFKYIWKNNEANFGPPQAKQIDGGLHITFEIILKKADKYIALRRPEAIPGHEPPPQKKSDGFFYFCHNLIRYGESVEDCVKRIVKEQAGVNVKSFKIIDLESNLQEKDNQWAFMPYILAELEELPQPGIYGNQVTEVVTFTKSTIPDDFGWWEQDELREFLEEIDKN